MYVAGMENLEEEDEELYRLTDPSQLHVPQSYKGPQLSFPLTKNQLESLIEAFRKKQVEEPFISDYHYRFSDISQEASYLDVLSYHKLNDQPQSLIT